MKFNLKTAFYTKQKQVLNVGSVYFFVAHVLLIQVIVCLYCIKCHCFIIFQIKFADRFSLRLMFCIV